MRRSCGECIANAAGCRRPRLSRESGPTVRDLTLVYRYSVVAAQWEAVRLKIDRGNHVTAADDRHLAELGKLLAGLTD